MADAVAILRRYERLTDLRRNYEPIWQDLADLILPRKSNIVTMRAPGSKQTERLFDSTAIHANDLLSASMQGSLTSAAVRWFHLRMRRAELNEQKPIAMWLDECATRIYVAFTQSNFNAELQEVYQDLGAFGIGAMMTDERQPQQGEVFGGFIFRALPLAAYAVDENAEGRVDTLYEVFKLSIRAAYDRWGKAIGEKLLKKLDTEHEYEMVEILHAVYPRQGGYGRTAKKMPYASCWVDKENRHLIAEGGFHEFPYCVPRWTKTSGEVYGRGPGHTALPDVKTLNKAVELTLQAWSLSVRPPLEVMDDGLIGSPKIVPAGVNTVRQMGNIKPIELGSRLDIAQVQANELRNSIKQMFFWDQLQLPQGGGGAQNTYMTATEVERRIELMQRVLGPTLGRLESELLSPLIERAFQMMLRRGALPEPPPELLEAGDAEINIEYEGPLARAQRGSEIMAVKRTMENILPIVQINPDTIEVIDLEETVRFVAEASGMPARLTRDKRTVRQMQQAKTQAREAEAQMQGMSQMAEAAGKAAPFLQVAQEFRAQQGGGAAPAPADAAAMVAQ